MSRSIISANTLALSRSHSSFRIKPLAAAVSFALLSAQVAHAQDQAAEGALEEVTVTGSRIQAAAGMTTPTPVTALSADDLKIMSPTSITESLTQLPQFINSQTAENFGRGSNGFFTSSGGGGLNLRGLNSNRTLVLLDGRRVPAPTIYGGPDVTTFPEAFLSGIDVVTGGASAAYGTDAVSGVVNYKLNHKFEGVRVTAQYGRTTHGDGDNTKYQLALGHELSDNIHLLFSAGYSNEDPVIGTRSWYNSCGQITNPAFGNTNPAASATSAAQPRYMVQCGLHPAQVSIDGVLNPNPSGATASFGKMTFDSRGNIIPFNAGTIVSGDGTLQVGGSGEDFATVFNVLRSGNTEKNLYTRLNFDVTDKVSVFVQGMHNEQLLVSPFVAGLYSTTLAGQNFTIFSDNAFLPASLSQAMQTANVPSFQFNRQLSQFDGPIGTQNNDGKLSVATLGFNAAVAGTWKMDGYAQYGTSKLDAVQHGSQRQDRIFLAADAVKDNNGVIRCRVNTATGAGSAYTARVPDCVPLNLFGRGAPSAAAFDWVTGFDPGIQVTTIPYIASSQSYATEAYQYTGDTDKHRIIEGKQTIAELSAQGEVVDTWAGPISAFVGVNYRKEAVEQKVHAPQGNVAADPNYFPVWCNDGQTSAQCVSQIAQGIRPSGNLMIRGVPVGVATNIVETQFSNVPNIIGSYDVKEVFGEVIVPVIKDLPWMKAMNFQGAYRLSNYEGSGNISSWKGGLDMSFSDEIRFRGTYSHDTRAGNLADRFDRTGGLSPNITDKKTPGANPIVTTPYAVTIVGGGNPNIKPETGDTFTVGVVYRPEWLSGMDMSVDWMRISIKNAIDSLSVQQIIDQCYVTGDQTQCSKITRGLDTQNRDVITFVNQARQNLSKATYNGVDVELGYTHPVEVFGGGERLSARLVGTFLLEASTTNFFGVKTDNTESVPLQTFRRKFNLNLSYSRGDFTWNMTGYYNSGGIIDKTLNLPIYDAVVGGLTQKWDVQDRDIGSSIYWDTRLAYRFDLGQGNIEVFGNVQNVFDRPPVYAPAVGLVQTFGAYDQVGRRFVLGANVKF